MVSRREKAKAVRPRTALTYSDPREIPSSQLPTARISVDESNSFGDLIQGFSSEFFPPKAKFPIEWLDTIENLSLVNPDVSQMVENIVQLGNTGHRIIIDDASESAQEAILEEINRMQSQAFGTFGSVEGFVNSALGQQARSGVFSNEWVLDEALEGVKYGVLVPTRSIRFVKDPESGRWMPYQKVNGLINAQSNFAGMLALNPLTYQYLPIQVLDSSPYGIPPALAALEPVLIQRDIVKNFRFVARKMGLLGLLQVLLKAPTKIPGEKEDAYFSRCRTYLQEQAAAVKNNFRDGIALGFQGQMQIEATSLMGNAAGAKEIHQAVGEMVYSGLKQDPAMHGRSYSTTETYAGVVYEKMLSQILNYQRGIKKGLEYGYKLHLTLAGISFKNLYVEFDPSRSLMPDRDESSYQMKLQNLETLYDQGIINQDSFAQEAGYDAPDLPEPRVSRDFGLGIPDDQEDDVEDEKSDDKAEQKMVLRWDRAAGRYKADSRKKKKYFFTKIQELNEEVASQIEGLRDEMEGVYGCECGHAHLAPRGRSAAKIEQFIQDYFKAAYPSIRGSRDKALREMVKFIEKLDPNVIDSEHFAEIVFDKLSTSFSSALNSSPLSNTVRKKSKKYYEYFRQADREPFASRPIQPGPFTLVDRNAVDFVKKSDDFYFGQFIKNKRTKTQLKDWLAEDFLTSGRSLRDPGEMEEFRKRFGNRLGKEDFQVLRVVETSVARAKNWGNALSVESARATQIEITGPDDNLTCDWCSSMIGKKFSVKPVIGHIKSVIERDPEDLPQLSPFLPGKVPARAVKEMSEAQLLAQGIALAPYHPHCRHRFVVTAFEGDDDE